MFWILWTAGMLGVLSFMLVDLSALIAALPPPEGEPVALPPPMVLKLVSIIQPTIIMTLAVILGIWLSPGIGLRSPAAEAAARGENYLAELKPQIIPGVIAGLLSGVAIVISWVVAKPFLSLEFIKAAEQFNAFIPAAVRLLYGGFTEELLLRWGLMTFLVWLGWKVFLRKLSTPGTFHYVAAILISAVLFGIGHLPVASMLAGGLTFPLVVYVITGNSIFGVVAGFLYWRRGLEAAIIAHMSAHVVLISAIYLAF